MTTTPTARPPGGGGGAIFGIAFLLLLLAGEYFLLTHRLTPAQERAEVAKDRTDALVATQAQADREWDAAHPGAPPHSAKPKPGGLLTGDPLGGLLGERQQAAMLTSITRQGTIILDMGAGLALRGVLLLICVAIIFTQSPPPQRIGEPRRIPRDPEAVKKPVLVLGALLAIGGLGLMAVGGTTGVLLVWGYPMLAALCLGCGLVAGQLRASTKETGKGLTAERKRIDTKYGIVLHAQGNRFVNVPNPFRGILVFGGAGAGKTFSIGEPILEQFIAKGMCGVVYDFKFPVLAAAVQKAQIHAEPGLIARNEAARKKDPSIKPYYRMRHHLINFVDMERTEKVNPLRAADMPVVAYAMEYSKTILANLSGGSKKNDGDNFFASTAENYMTAIIWFYRNNYPAMCTVPHVVATVLFEDYTHVLSMLSTFEPSRVLVQSIVTAVENNAGKQLAGTMSTLQNSIAKLSTPEICWVMAPDEANGEGFSLDINNPDNPALLTIGNDPTLAKTFAPVISCIVAVSMKLMNQQHKHPSFIFIDEAPTIFIEGLEVIPATARSNEVSLVLLMQDKAQAQESYGREKTEVLVSNMNNQFFGKVNSLETAKLVSEIVGREEEEVISISAGKSMGGGKTGGGRNVSQSVSVQERQRVRIQDVYGLRQGEFIGQTVETEQTFFQAVIKRKVLPGDYPIEPIASFEYGEGLLSPDQAAEVAQMKLRHAAQLAKELGLNAGGSQLALSDAESAAAQQADAAQPAPLSKRTDQRQSSAPATAMEAMIQANYVQITVDVTFVIQRYPNELNPKGKTNIGGAIGLDD